jgi:hypothetical protein
MKKFSIILLALVFTVSFVGAAMAYHEGDEGTSEGALGVYGKYTLDAESYSGQGDAETKWYDDDFELVFKVNLGTVTGVVDLEISDDEDFAGGSAEGNAPGSIIDNYWIEWNSPIVDGLKFKIGEYGLTFGRAVIIYADPAAHTIGGTYALEGVDLGLYVSKVVDPKANDSNDHDVLTFTANVKSIDFFKKLNFIYLSGADDINDESYSVIGIDTAFEAGPVDIALEYGSVSDDVVTNEADFTYAQFGLDRVVGYGLNLEYFTTSDTGNLNERTDYGSGLGGDYYPLMIYAFRSGVNSDLEDVTMIMLGGSYGINDNNTLKGKVLVSGDAGPNDDSIGTEFDLHLVHKFADDISATFTYASWSPGDAYFGGDGDTQTDLRARFSFKF